MLDKWRFNKAKLASLLHDFSEPLIGCYDLESSKRGIWSLD